MEAAMFRSVASISLLLVSIAAPASAMDQSAMEETNCLMACDANQENCGAGQLSRKNHSDAGLSSHREVKSSPAIGARGPARASAAYERTLAHSTEVKR
jgi:hypothetical protein